MKRKNIEKKVLEQSWSIEGLNWMAADVEQYFIILFIFHSFKLIYICSLSKQQNKGKLRNKNNEREDLEPAYIVNQRYFLKDDGNK